MSTPFSMQLIVNQDLTPNNNHLFAFSGAVVSPAVQSLVRKLLTARREQTPSAHEKSAKAVGFELTAEELSCWVAEAVSQISVGSRAALLSLRSSSAQQSISMQKIFQDLRDGFSEMGLTLDSFMRRQAIKVDTQVIDSV